MISHTILHLQCTEGVSTERSLELFRAYNYTPRIAELLAMRFYGAPVIFLVAKLEEDYRGFQFPATLRRGQPQNSLNDQQSTTHS